MTLYNNKTICKCVIAHKPTKCQENLYLCVSTQNKTTKTVNAGILVFIDFTTRILHSQQQNNGFESFFGIVRGTEQRLLSS